MSPRTTRPAHAAAQQTAAQQTAPPKPPPKPAPKPRKRAAQAPRTTAMAARIPSGDRADRKRQAIVSAARKAFVRDGFEAGMDLIAAEAGVSKVTVYNHFGSKEALFL